ncbi:hypothetical protein [Chthonobacter rhizosphaerae]|uniref:hypothetical protein n=1 Tax=Chthonobacter rhizosphaerae TaxID=2735553 RepID=UPI0015EE5605|nr:hypothetical protein [Chthonobacter rhizosphaerae]
MAEKTWPPAVLSLVRKGRIDPEDVQRLRATVYGKVIVTREEAEWAFALDERVPETCPEWTGFFVEMVTDFVVWQEQPRGYVTPAATAWLVGAVSDRNLVKTRSELEVLIRVLEAAQSSPPELSAFVLRQVAAAVLAGEGPLAPEHRGAACVITRDEVELVRRVLFAFGGGGSIGITRDEAEVLFDLNDSLLEGESDPAWSDLFVKAVANFLMAARGYTVPPREEVLRREAWLDAPSGGVVGLFDDAMSGLLTHGLKGIWSAFRAPEPSPQAEQTRAFEAEIRDAEPLTADEVKWLAERIGRDGPLHANERALLTFLREESPDIHPSLRTLLDTAA